MKVPVSPGTTLNEVVLASVKHFKLEGEYHLQKEGKPVELDLPWRLLNYTANSKFDLVEGTSVANKKNDRAGQKIKIRFQVAGKGTVVKEIANNEPLSVVINELATEQQWASAIDDVSVQFFSKTIKSTDFNFTTLRSLAIESPSNIKIILGYADKVNEVSSVHDKSKVDDQDIKAESAVASIKDTEDNVVNESHEYKLPELHQPTVYLPPETSISQRMNDNEELNEEDYELTVDHAKLYQNIVAKQAGSLGGPLMTRRMREEQEARLRSNLKKITQCFIRIRFPDLTQMEIVFKADDTVDTVYEVVGKMVTVKHFGLYQTHPHKKIDPSDLKLVDDLQFGTKTILLFESEHSPSQGRFIDEDIFKSAKNITDSIERPNQEHKELDGKTLEEVSRDNRKLNYTREKSNKIPKWLKLSKK